MERKVLGRGLEALISPDSQSSKERVQILKVSQVQASRLQPRLKFPQEKIEELAKSIQEKGVIQPILVRQTDGENFELIAGERRLRAIKHLGIQEIPAIVRRVSDADLLELSIIENVQREELGPLEEAKAYQRLCLEFGMTQDHIAQRVGKDKSSISNLLRILNLPEKIQALLNENLISFGHAKAILSVQDPKKQLFFCEKIIERNLSVRQAEFLIKPPQSGRRAILKTALASDQNVKSLEERLQHALGTKVRVQHGKKRGKIEIEYYSLEDLERLSNLLTRS
jgi:ParB family chromosome partitioning protein